MVQQTLRIGFWNILANGLSAGEFMSPERGEAVALWDERATQIAEKLRRAFTEDQLDMVGLVENDMPQDLLKRLNTGELRDTIGCVYIVNGERGTTNASTIRRELRGEDVWGYKPESVPAALASLDQKIQDYTNLRDIATTHADKTAHQRQVKILQTRRKALTQGMTWDQRGFFETQEAYERAVAAYNAQQNTHTRVHDDGLSMYYRKDRVCHAHAESPTNFTAQTTPGETAQTGAGRPYHTWTFHRVGRKTHFRVTVAHLTSGESNKGAAVRMLQMHAMMQDKDVQGSVIVMDSNFSRHYPDGSGVPDPQEDDANYPRSCTRRTRQPRAAPRSISTRARGTSTWCRTTGMSASRCATPAVRNPRNFATLCSTASTASWCRVGRPPPSSACTRRSTTRSTSTSCACAPTSSSARSSRRRVRRVSGYGPRGNTRTRCSGCTPTRRCPRTTPWSRPRSESPVVAPKTTPR